MVQVGRMKFEIITGDITKPLGVQAIVNAGNHDLTPGGGVNGAIHRAAGPELLDECRKLSGCRTGEAKITKAYNLPCDYVIHTVGPKWKDDDWYLLMECYYSSLNLAEKYGIRSIAFPAISTGKNGFPLDVAAKLAVRAPIHVLSANDDLFDRIVFVMPSEESCLIYNDARNKYYGKIGYL